MEPFGRPATHACRRAVSGPKPACDSNATIVSVYFMVRGCKGGRGEAVLGHDPVWDSCIMRATWREAGMRWRWR